MFFAMLTQKLGILLICLITGVELHELSGCEDMGCSHGCVEKAKGPTCTCPEDMVLGYDKEKCQVAVKMLLGMFRGISEFSERSKDYRKVVYGKVNAFDFHYARNEIFAYSNNTISRSSIDDPQKKVQVVMTPDAMVTSLAVDWVNDDLYWIGQQRSAVEAASMNGSDHRVISKHNDTAKPAHWHNIVVDPYVRKLFWLGDTQVFSSDLTGSNMKSRLPISSDQFKPEDITLDVRNQLMYIIGSKGSTGSQVVIRSKYDETQSTEVLSIDQPGSDVYGFGVLGKVLYWQSSHDGETLYKCEIPKTGQTPKVVLIEELYQVVYDMKVYHANIQKTLKK